MIPFKLHGIRADIVLKAVPQPRRFFQIKVELTFLASPVKAVQHMKFFLCIQFLTLRSKRAEMRTQSVSGTEKIISCILHVLPVYRDRHIQFPDHAVCTDCLFHQHLIDFFSVLIQTILLHGNKDRLFQLFFVQSADDHRQFRRRPAVKKIEDTHIV